jgi:chloramphenicol 3-O-phosphotransferase
MSRLGPETLTREALEAYLAKGRRLHSAYVCGFFVRLWRLLGAVLFQTTRWISPTLDSRRATLAERIHGLFRWVSRVVHRRRGHGKWDQTRYYRPCG